MARTPRASDLETRTARLKLKPAKKPYWASSGREGLHLGYRRRKPRAGDSNGVWIRRVYTGAGSYETEKFAEADDFAEADGASVLTYFMAMERLGADYSVIQKRTRYTVEQAVKDYAALQQSKRKDPRDTERKLHAYLLSAKPDGVTEWRDRLVSDLTREDFERWLTWATKSKPAGRRKRPQKAKRAHEIEIDPAEVKRRRQSTVNRVLNVVKACLNYAYEMGRVGSDDAWRGLTRYENADSARIQWLSNEEARRLVNACDPSFRRIVQAGLLTGARWGELRRLRARDYDERSGTIRIEVSKSGKKRTIPLTDEGVAAFESWIAGLDGNAYVFTREDGEPWGLQDQKRPMQRACDAASIKPRVGFHALRHSYASALIQAGVSSAIVAAALGHSGTRMVELHYGHLGPSHIADAIRAKLPSIGVQIDTKVTSLRRA